MANYVPPPYSGQPRRYPGPVSAVAPQAALANHDYAFRIRIDTSTTVRQVNNIVDIAGSAAEQAGAIAEAVTAECGIPMIDGNGHPRPIDVEISACLTVDGSGNFVGDDKSLAGVVQQQ
ncbi:uncharacterized protein J7T54_000401 [Emericellopsis cladophorae]|uniref:Uncharacterized protein n=1 Tax=Emericellopsis cladophorae TaxID=2686198 RepID=A0A9P9XU30_9HYPO|nr:uncharacterized protein J7T54_000401 [Emericellopsis cladophorae]KAI6777811.1 hypothetical protein J7T54_000401 [Emericellopsis cladophorae]